MKILQINTVYREKSTGRTCIEVEKALEKCGHSSITAYGTGKKENSPNAYLIDSRVEYLMHNLLSKVTGLEGYFSILPTIRLICFMKKYAPDLIHLRNIHGHFLNLPLLFWYLKKTNIPVVQNLHDCWAYTGGCCYYTTRNCYKWKKQCANCPRDKRDYPESLFFDFSRKAFKDKKRWYASLSNLHVIGVSKWVSNEAKESFLGTAKTVSYIYNWINRDVFHPGENNKAVREKYRIPKDKFVVIGVSAQWNIGSPRYEDFMEMASLIGKDMVIVMIGKSTDIIQSEKIIHIPFISDTNELARLYSCADVYVHCSIEDTFGKVIAEAMACGTPVVVYDVTACAELVKEGCGYVVEPRNMNQVLGSIEKIKSDGKEKYSQNCVQNVAMNFDFETNTKKLIDLYSTIIAERS